MPAGFNETFERCTTPLNTEYRGNEKNGRIEIEVLKRNLCRSDAIITQKHLFL